MFALTAVLFTKGQTMSPSPKTKGQKTMPKSVHFKTHQSFLKTNILLFKSLTAYGKDLVLAEKTC